MSAFSNRALSRRASAVLTLLIAITCALAITMLAHSHSPSQPSTRSLIPANVTSASVRHHHPVRHHHHSNAGYGLNF